MECRAEKKKRKYKKNQRVKRERRVVNELLNLTKVSLSHLWKNSEKKDYEGKDLGTGAGNYQYRVTGAKSSTDPSKRGKTVCGVFRVGGCLV